jgi:hypothetical protein
MLIDMMSVSFWRTLLALLILSALALVSPSGVATSARPTAPGAHTTYLPLVQNSRSMPFGVQPDRGQLAKAIMVERARELGVQWTRLDMAFWRDLQPTRGAPYNVAALAQFERDLDGAVAAGLTPMVVILGSPPWATINQPYPTSCGAIRADRFADFAALLEWLAARYKDRVDYWEIGNEPDIDPSLVKPDEVFGCWGDIKDFYYGGEHYGKMLKAVAPAIRRANPRAKIMLGGLALLTPKTPEPHMGKPENFFEGILRSGAGDSFDIVTFHSYPWFSSRPLDYDYDADTQGPWKLLGGYTLGKAKFLRTLMAKYGVADKPLFLNETALTCAMPPEGPCPGVGPGFDRSQANFLVRMLTRGWAAGIQQFSWFTLDWPGFRSGSLLDKQYNPRLVYTAYQTFIAQTSPSDQPVRVYSYDRDDVSVETYRFTKGSILVDVLWGKDLSTYYVKAPPGFIKAYDQFGEELPRLGPYLPVSFSAIYIQHQR